MNKFTEAQKKEFLNWVSGLCNGRSDQWKAELLTALLAEHEAKQKQKS